ncbi:MAG TPA: elongation factor G [Rhodocyclaceae bacterium]|nr:elongation factor G [Rhodocyclaceae bacterium]HMW50654.1 elongation factor G [Rhodocyclaceae bacterium]HMZ76734.1 elongation factor G [Rhodocyclaceae bacterium]HNA68514.1 elongation factor G [Rhodocyclaceae bacterium]HNB64949.1 elongation factor G [Rhodocyclaceae bacterium]
MTPTSVRDIRNLSLLGQSGSGKTTLLEKLLATAGAIGAPGSVEKGDTVSDFDPQEKTFGHSLNTALAHLEWAEHWVNLLDTPGLPDFLGRALASLPAVETAVVVINAAAGVETVTRRIMDAAADKCRMLVVNRIDAPGVDFGALMEHIVASFGKECLPINLPLAGGTGVVDCFFKPDYDAVPAFSSVREAHDRIVDQVVEVDEDLMALYLEQGESLQPAQLHDPFEQALREGHLIPVCFTSARSGAGVSELLDILGRLLPDPTEGNPPHFLKGEGPAAQPVEATTAADQHVIAHVFQVSNDPFRGKLGLFRIHQGTVTPATQLFVGDARKPFKVGHLLRIQGKTQTEITVGIPGDLCAVARVDEIHRDAVLHDSHDEDHFHLVPPRYPQPVFGLALQPEKHGDEQKLSDALHRLLDEDPCLSVEHDTQAKETVIRGLGEVHLKVVLEQLKTRWNLSLVTRPPAIPYRETIAGTAEARYRHKKQSGGAGQFGEVALRVETLERGAGVVFADEVKGGVIPGNFMPAVEKGVHQAVIEGVMAGFPLQDLRVVVFDGKHHAVDSNEISFVTAARHAVQEAVQAARPVVLEPLVTLTVRIADEHFGGISAELSGRRGRVTGTDAPQAGVTEITSLVPMAELEGFESRLKSISGGDGSCAIAFSHYEPAPAEVQQRLAREHAGKRGGEQ